MPPDERLGMRARVEARLTTSPLEAAARTVLLDSLEEDRVADGSAPSQRAFLRSVEVRGFRGIGRGVTLPLTPGPGLTLIVGRNGSGKSSFAEAIEIALTGDNARWSKDRTKRTDIWRQGWRNLHEEQAPRVAVELQVAGVSEPTRVVRTWYGDDVADATALVERPGQAAAPLASLGWEQALSLYRPFLPYSELGQIIGSAPSQMYDALADILGLEQLAAADTRLRELAKEYDAPIKRGRDELPPLLAALSAVDDPRARAAVAALEGRKKDLARAAELVTGQSSADDGALRELRRRAELTGPDPAAVQAAVDRLREALAAAEDIGSTSAEDARLRADLLERAVAHQRRHPDEETCPVCGSRGRLGEEWAEAAEEQITHLREEAAAAEKARWEVGAAADAIRHLVLPPPDWLPRELAAAWDDWLACRSLGAPRELADRAMAAASAVSDTCRITREEAAKRLADLNGTWHELSGRLAAWLETARGAEAAKPRFAQVKAARDWLRSAVDELRAEQLRPIADGAQEIWATLRQQSNVALGPVQLRGSGTRRKVVLDVTVDDKDAPALGVMSQGELHSLALSLFLPRTKLPENPFRFLVIDDPVQSMDPAKVDGLARVLSELAKDRQVVVFTHDTRLRQALTYQRLSATVLEVRRSEGSAVEVKEVDDPVKQALKEAQGLIDDRHVPGDAMAAVLPGLCRTVLEAAFLEVARGRLYADGVDPTVVEERIEKAYRSKKLTALALYGDASRVSEAMQELRRAHGHWATELIDWCNQGAHGTAPIGDPRRWVQDTRRLARKVRGL